MSYFTPDYIFEKTENITPEFLKQKGIRALALDVDNTLTTHGNMAVSDSMRQWIAGMKAAGIGLMIVSNNKFTRVSPLAIQLGLPYTSFAIKPFARGFLDVCRYFTVTSRELGVVGDQIFTDILGGNWFGSSTILVHPIRKEGSAYFKIKRSFEQPFIRRYYKRGGKLR